MKLLFPMFLFVGVLSADEKTYFIQKPNLEEWRPPVDQVRELPDAVVKKVHVIEQSGRHVYIEECEPPVEVAKTKKEKLAPVVDFSKAQKEKLEKRDEMKFLHISATVYYENEKPYSHIRLQIGREKIEVWSSMNFMEMASMHHYMARGIEYITIAGHGESTSMSVSEAGCPVHQGKFKRENATFVVDEKDESGASALEAVRGLHAIYNQEKATLQAASFTAWHAARQETRFSLCNSLMA